MKEVHDRSASASAANSPADLYERFFIFATLWAFGGPLPCDGRVARGPGLVTGSVASLSHDILCVEHGFLFEGYPMKGSGRPESK